MADKEFVKPIPYAFPVGPAGQDMRYDFEQFLAEIAWEYAQWNEDGWEEAQVRIGQAVDAAAVGEPIRLTLDDWEKLREAVKATPIKGRFAPKLRVWKRLILSATRPEGG